MNSWNILYFTAQKMKFFIKDFFSNMTKSEIKDPKPNLDFHYLLFTRLSREEAAIANWWYQSHVTILVIFEFSATH